MTVSEPINLRIRRIILGIISKVSPMIMNRGGESKYCRG